MKTSESITVAIPVRKIAPGIGKFMGRTRRRQGSPKTERKADGNQLSEGGNRRRGGTAGGGSPTTSKFERWKIESGKSRKGGAGACPRILSFMARASGEFFFPPILPWMAHQTTRPPAKLRKAWLLGSFTLKSRKSCGFPRDEAWRGSAIFPTPHSATLQPRSAWSFLYRPGAGAG